MTAKRLSTSIAALLLTLGLLGCRTLLPSPGSIVAPPPVSAWHATELAPGVQLLEYQGPTTTLSANAAYVSGSGGSIGIGVNLSGPRNRGAGGRQLPRIQAAAVVVDLSLAELLPVVDRPPARQVAGTEPAAPGEGNPAGGSSASGAPGENAPSVETVDDNSGRDEAILSLRPSVTVASRPELLAAINATPFEPGVTSIGRPVDPLGLVLLGGERISRPNPRYGALYLLERGEPVIAQQPTAGETGAVRSNHAVRHAVGGYFVVLEEGELRGNRRQRAARSAVAITADGERAILFAAAGGAPGTSVGLTAEEVGRWLKSLGGDTALMLDGGGSTSLAVRDAGHARMAVTPSWGPTLGVERPVATILAVRRR